MPDVTSDWGSFAFPGPAVRESVDDFIRHFTTAPIAEQALANAVTAYREYSELFITEEAGRRADHFFYDTDDGKAMQKKYQGRPKEGTAEYTRLLDEYEVEVRQEYGLPTKLTAGSASTVVRAAQMHWLRSLLRDDESKEQVMHHRMILRDEEMTVAEIAERYRTWEWQQDAITNLGDLRTQRSMERLIQQTMATGEAVQHQLEIDRARYQQGL